MRFSVEPPINSIRSSSSTIPSSSCSSSSQQQHQHLSHHQPSDSSGFQQWHDAMRMVARLPGGVPPEFRRKVTNNQHGLFSFFHAIDCLTTMRHDCWQSVCRRHRLSVEDLGHINMSLRNNNNQSLLRPDYLATITGHHSG